MEGIPMPDASRTSALRRIVTLHVLGVAVGSLGATALSTVLVFASSSQGGVSEAPPFAQNPDLAAPAASSPLFVIPDGVRIIDADEIGRAIELAQFFESLAALPVIEPTPAPVVEEPPAPPPPTIPAPRPTVPAVQPTVAPPPPPPPTPTAAPAIGVGLDTSPMSAQEQALFDATNARRASAGLPPLRANGYLVGVARVRSQDMATNNYFSHTSPVTGDTAFSLMEAYGVPYGWAGENLAMNNYPAGEAVGVADQALWDSPPHRENILNQHYTEMGIGLRVSASGMYYFTVVFTGPV
jgi:uncharacterized protein YkwD